MTVQKTLSDVLRESREVGGERLRSLHTEFEKRMKENEELKRRVVLLEDEIRALKLGGRGLNS